MVITASEVPPPEFLGYQLVPESWMTLEGASRISVDGVISPYSTAGPYTAMGFIDEPGGRLVPVARFRTKFLVFFPVPPERATMLPSVGSMITMALSSCCPVRLE